MRIGQGYDIHRLEGGRKLILGGVDIPFDKGLVGHSDGDALTHAVIDALLGAACLGDIGVHYPPSEQAYAGANSINLLKQVGMLLVQRNYRIINIDSTLIAEKPKLSKFYALMQCNLAGALKLEIDQISIKAKTMEGLGEIGAGEAIAAQAIALIEFVV
ncbi:MAG: 2-C-methyl-D-erythritol 2,4-cyclodiphosphate synthase [Candidatus Obscuribacterales bacterium]|nr:2-C-methyl-D-erythritol 2,4-cyclodiphosphate synthase [Candidatus Obscuribacterales bacterium]